MNDVHERPEFMLELQQLVAAESSQDFERNRRIPLAVESAVDDSKRSRSEPFLQNETRIAFKFAATACGLK